jgi:hypothetical protein
MRFKVNRRPAWSCAWRVPRPARTEGSQALCSVIENMIGRVLPVRCRRRET